MKKEKEFDAVKMMRDIRDKIDKDIEGMTVEELLEYIRKGREEFIRTVGEPKSRTNKAQ